MLKNLRVQRKRTKGYRQPAGCISVARPSMWGNPFETASEYRLWLTTDWEPDANCDPAWERFLVKVNYCPHPEIECRYDTWDYRLLEKHKRWILRNIPTLRNKQLSCFCSLEVDCHADVLIELSNR